MLSGSFEDADVLDLSYRVLVNGIERAADSWSVDRELQGDLPQQVTAVSGVTQATGKIVWSPQSDVSMSPPNPWNGNGGWVPSRGDRVEIFVGDGDAWWKRFHGLVDKTTGDIGSGFQSTIIDDYDKLSAPVSHPAMTAIMPPRISGDTSWRNVGLHPLYYVDLALRRAGFNVTPRREQNTLLFAPLQGSLWPHYGQLNRTENTGSLGGLNKVTPWGLAKGGFTVWYSVPSSQSMAQNVQVSFLVGFDHASATDITLDYGSTDFLRVSVSSSRTVTVRRNSTTITSLSLNAGDFIVSVLAKNQQVSIQTNTGRSAEGSFTPSSAGMSGVRINAGDDASIAGFQVSRPQSVSQEHASTRAVLNARLDTTSLVYTGSITAAPNIEDVPAARLLEQINDAILGALWIDELGEMQWAQSDTLRRRLPVKTVTTADDIFSLPWESGLLQSAASVTITGKMPSITRSRWRTITVAESGQSQTLRAGDEFEVILEPGSNEDWILPSFDFLEVGGQSGGWGSFNNPEFSTVGLHFERGGEEITGSVPYQTTITTHELGFQKTLIKYVAGNWPSDVQGVLSTPPEDVPVVLWPRNRNQPIIRQKASGLIEWNDERLTITGVGGPGPELVHDVGVWSATSTITGEGTDYWERIGNYIQSQVTVPQPVVRSVDTAPDPRLQLADVITIHSDLLGVELRSLITGFSESFDASGYHQDLDVRVLEAETTSQTYAAFQQGLPDTNLTYTQWQALGPVPQTYTEFNEGA